MPKTTRIIDGKRFIYWSFYHKKKWANHDADKIRARGQLARVIPSGNGYEVWVH